MSHTCPTRLTRVPVTRPPFPSGVLEGKRAVEAELETCKAKLRAVEAQLLEVLEEKLRLKKEVEAWEEDMQQLVWQRVESQLQRESRSTLGAPMEPGAARAPWVRFPLGRWGRWR
ncbi:BICD family-like cargo adapter 2 isoform 2-T2 [Hipposideros larvatus]